MDQGKKIHCEMNVAATESSLWDAGDRSNITAPMGGTGESLGVLQGTTLTERVIGFLERYSSSAYALR